MNWLADENFRDAIIRGLLRRAPKFDIVRAQDIPEIAGRMIAFSCDSQPPRVASS